MNSIERNETEEEAVVVVDSQFLAKKCSLESKVGREYFFLAGFRARDS